MPFRGLIAYVSGGGSGIGFNAIRALLVYNIKGVLFTDNKSDDGEAAEECFCKEFGPGRAIFYQSDVTEEHSVRAAMEKAVEKYCNLDIVVNNAGIIAEDNINKTVKTHYDGVIIGTRLAMTEFIPKYKSGPCGYILNVASITGLDPMWSIPIESSSKHAVIGFSRAVATDRYFDMYKCNVCVICPGVTETPILKQGGKKLRTEIFEMRMQQPDIPGNDCAVALKCGINGAVFVSEGNELYRIEFPDKDCLRQEFP